jgi:hypothetical protein
VPAAELNHPNEFFSLCADVLFVVGQTGVIQLANPAATRLLGLELEELTGLVFLDLVHPDDRARVERAFGDRAERIGFACRFRARDDSYRNISWKLQTHPSAGVRYLIGANSDAHKRIEQELRDSELTVRALFDNAAQGILSVDRDGRIRSVNPMAEQLFGYERAELLGKNVDMLLPEALRKAHAGHRADSFASPRTRPMGLGLDLAARRKDGSEFPVEISLSHIETNEGPIAVAFVNDISERKAALSEKEKLERRLEHATKMEAVGRLAGGIAHDFNNLLTALSGFSEIVLDELPETHPLCEGARETYKTCQRSASLVRRLLAVSRRQMLQPKVLDLNAKLGEIEKMLRGLLGEDIELRVKLSRNLGFVRADESQIEQVILNLVVNARDAMPKGGRLTLQTANFDVDDAFAAHHVGIRRGPHVLLTVSDSGEGIDEQTLEHIFEPFYTTKERGKGTGLGLATVYGIVQQSNGYVWVYSERGQGTTFKIYLPQVDRTGRDVDDDSSAEREKQGSETVLVVEDENTVRLVTVSNLRKGGYVVLEARDGEEALRIAANYGGSIDLVLTDVVMPRMNGPEMLRRLQERFPAIKSVFMSGHVDDTLVHRGVIEEGLAFIEKPFNREQMAKRIRAVLDER